MSDTSRDVGVLLKEERERKGIALDVVHEATKVPLDALKAIEEGYKVRTLTAFYYKSFVKIYAQYLGLDANFVATLIPTHHPKPAVPVTAVRPGAVQASRSSGAGAHRVEGTRSRSWNLLAHPIVLKKKKRIFRMALFVVIAVIGVALAVWGVRKISANLAINRALDTTHTASQAPLKKAVKVASKPESSKPVAVKVEAQKPAAAPVPVVPVPDVKAVKRVSITVRAQVSTWISVRADGAAVFQGHIKKGTASTWHALKKIELSAKDISVLEFEINGRNVGKLARRDLKAKKVIVTPEGLDVEK